MWVYVAAFHVGAIERADWRVLVGFVTLRTPESASRAGFVTHGFDATPFALAALLVLGAAWWRGRARLALATGAILIGANVSTELLKRLTAAPREPSWMPQVSWPSGHVTAAASLALCVVLVAPAALRPYAAVAAGLGVFATAVSVLILGTHHPSDALGGMLMAGMWASLAVAALELAEQRRPSARRPEPALGRQRALWPAAGAAACAIAVLLALVASVAPPGAYLAGQTTFVAGALALALAGATLPAAAATL